MSKEHADGQYLATERSTATKSKRTHKTMYEKKGTREKPKTASLFHRPNSSENIRKNKNSSTGRATAQERKKKRSGARTAQETPREVAGNEVTTALRLRSGAGTGAHNGDFSSCGLSYQNTRGEEGHRPIRRFGSSNKGERLVVH